MCKTWERCGAGDHDSNYKYITYVSVMFVKRLYVTGTAKTLCTKIKLGNFYANNEIFMKVHMHNHVKVM